jgi:hypothetical protein
MACLEALLGRVGEGEVAEVAVRAALRILSYWLAFIHQRLKVLGTPTRAVTASSSFSTSTSSRFLFCCEACFLTFVGRVRPVIPGATISAHSREFGCTGKLCRIASQRNFGGDRGPCTFAAGVSLTDALRFGSFNSPDRRTPQQPLFRLHICSAAVAYHLRGPFCAYGVRYRSHRCCREHLQAPLTTASSFKMADIEAELAAAGKELDKASHIYIFIHVPS